MLEQKKTNQNDEPTSPSEEIERAGATPQAAVDEPPQRPEEVPDLVPSEPSNDLGAAKDDTTPFDDDKTDQAINDIVAKESDELLAAEDAAIPRSDVPHHKHGGWRSKLLGWAVVLLLVGSIIAFALVPTVRYWALNTAGVRVESSVTVVDATTRLPLKGVEFTVGQKKTQTDSKGKARLSGLRLGSQTLTIQQNGFASVKRTITVGWGSNPQDIVALRAVGVRYVIEVRDYLSDKPIAGVEASDGEATAISDNRGKITLTLPNSRAGQAAITLAKSGYRTDKITLNDDLKQSTKAALVVDRKAIFITKQSGKYDVYKSDIDGQNKELLLGGTGKETSNLSLVVSPDGNRAALVSTRADKHDATGALLHSLALIDVETGDVTTIAESPQIQLIDWIGPRLIFQQVASDSSASNRYTVVAYNYKDNTRVQLAAANKLGAVLSARGALYYVVAPSASDALVQVGLFKISPDGTGKQTLLQDEVWSVLRASYDNFHIQLADETWQSYNLATGVKAAINTGGTPVGSHHAYVDNASGTKSLLVSQGSLINYDIVTGKETTIKTDSALTYPLRWLTDDAALYRISAKGEVADYAVSALGGVARKVADVTNTYGFAHGQ